MCAGYTLNVSQPCNFTMVTVANCIEFECLTSNYIIMCHDVSSLYPTMMGLPVQPGVGKYNAFSRQNDYLFDIHLTATFVTLNAKPLMK